jgi:plastocyanin
MKRMDRRKFMLVASVGSTGAILVACGNDPDDVDLTPTMIPVDGAPPTLAPYATPGGGAAPDEGGDEGADTSGGGDAVTLEAQDPFNWSTNELEATPGQVIQVTNTGAMEHDFVIDELGIAEQLPNGEPVEITLPDDLTVGDTYTYYCSVPGHRESGMEGTLTIVEASAEAPAEEEGEEAPAEGDGGGASGPVALEAQDPFNWSTNELEAAPGQVIQVTNTGAMEHDFVIDELGIAEQLPNGEPVEVTLPEDLTVGDTYTYYCSVPGHRESGMEGTLTIIEAAAAAPAEGEDTEAEAEGAGGVETASGPVTLEAQDPFNWSTNELEAAPGQVIQVTNAGVMEHDFVIDELEIQEVLPNGEPVEITLPEDLSPGDTYTYYCSVPGHRESGMEGTLTIVEAAPAASTGAGGSEQEAAEGEGEASPAAEGGEPVLLVATDPYQWSTHALKAAPGQAISLVNSGLLEHDFVVDELGLNVPMPIGGTVEATIPNDAPVGDEYEFYCSVAGHRESGMKGSLTIVESTAETSPAAQAEGADATPELEELPNVSDDALALMEDSSVVTLEATDPYNWSWKAIEAAPGQVVRVLNRGVLEHDFVIDELEIGQTLPFGEPIDIQIPDSVAVGDTYEYYCSIPGHRERGMVGTLTIIEAGAAASPVAATPEAAPADEEAVAGDAEGVELKTVDIAFEPKEFTIPAGTDVVVTITNEGALEHDFHVDDLGVASDLLGNGESTSVTINGEAGTYEFYCGVPGHKEAGMVGTLTIE